MSTRIIKQLASQSARLLVLVALALSAAAAQSVQANPPAPLASTAPLPLTSHGRVLGLQLGDFYSSIDPTLTWNTFLGGSGGDEGRAVAVDGNGNVYVAGSSTATWGSPVRPYTSGFLHSDAFAAKLSPGGALVWNTFLGGDLLDYGSGIALDANGNVYVAGQSGATWGSPVEPPIDLGNPFVAKLTSDGVLVWNTFMGSGMDSGGFIAVDGNANVYAGGSSQGTWGSPLRAYSSGTDVFMAKLNPSGILLWNTFLGGNGNDNARRMALDGNGNMHVAGISTESWGSPRRAYTGGEDGFVAKLDADGGLIWSTFLGGGGNDHGAGVGLDGSGSVYVSGISNATWGSPRRDYTSANDAFVAKLNWNGDLTWNTFLGGSTGDGGIDLGVDKSGDVYVAGYSSSSWGTPIRPYASGYDAFAAKLDSSGVLAWNTFLGGNGLDFGMGIAPGGSGNVYVAGYSSAGWGSPIHPYTSGEDAFVVRIDEASLYLPLVVK